MGDGVNEEVLKELLSLVKEIQETKSSKENASLYELNKQLELAIDRLQADSKTTDDIIEIVKKNLPIFTDQEHIKKLIEESDSAILKEVKRLIEEFGKELTPKFVTIVRREIKLFFSPFKVFGLAVTIAAMLFVSTFAGIWYTSKTIATMDTKVNTVIESQLPTGEIGRRILDLEEHKDDHIESNSAIKTRLEALESKKGAFMPLPHVYPETGKKTNQ
jgi:hypothetical protein